LARAARGSDRPAGEGAASRRVPQWRGLPRSLAALRQRDCEREQGRSRWGKFFIPVPVIGLLGPARKRHGRRELASRHRGAQASSSLECSIRRTPRQRGRTTNHRSSQAGLRSGACFHVAQRSPYSHTFTRACRSLDKGAALGKVPHFEADCCHADFFRPPRL